MLDSHAVAGRRQPHVVYLSSRFPPREPLQAYGCKKFCHQLRLGADFTGRILDELALQCRYRPNSRVRNPSRGRCLDSRGQNAIAVQDGRLWRRSSGPRRNMVRVRRTLRSGRRARHAGTMLDMAVPVVTGGRPTASPSMRSFRLRAINSHIGTQYGGAVYLLLLDPSHDL